MHRSQARRSWSWSFRLGATKSTYFLVGSPPPYSAKRRHSSETRALGTETLSVVPFGPSRGWSDSCPWCGRESLPMSTMTLTDGAAHAPTAVGKSQSFISGGRIARSILVESGVNQSQKAPHAMVRPARSTPTGADRHRLRRLYGTVRAESLAVLPGHDGAAGKTSQAYPGIVGSRGRVCGENAAQFRASRVSRPKGQGQGQRADHAPVDAGRALNRARR